MKLIRAIVRPETMPRVIEALERNQVYGMTRMSVTGRGKEMGITQGPVRYSEMPKEMLMIAIPNDIVSKVVNAITIAARTGSKESPAVGNIGDGKIFVTDIDESYIIRTGEKIHEAEPR